MKSTGSNCRGCLRLVCHCAAALCRSSSCPNWYPWKIRSIVQACARSNHTHASDGHESFGTPRITTDIHRQTDPTSEAGDASKHVQTTWSTSLRTTHTITKSRKTGTGKPRLKSRKTRTRKPRRMKSKNRPGRWKTRWQRNRRRRRRNKKQE